MPKTIKPKITPDTYTTNLKLKIEAGSLMTTRACVTILVLAKILFIDFTGFPL